MRKPCNPDYEAHNHTEDEVVTTDEIMRVAKSIYRRRSRS